jgi:biotin operon repressor
VGRIGVVAKASRFIAAQRTPRTGTKQETVLAMLRRDAGASGPQIAAATGWASHTVRGFLAGLKKKGFTIATLERVRTVGPNKEGAKGSYTIYRIEEAA